MTAPKKPIEETVPTTVTTEYKAGPHGTRDDETLADLKALPTNTTADIASLRADLAVLDDTIGTLIDEVNERIDGLVTPNRVEALRGAVALHSAIAYRSHATDIDLSVTNTAGALLAWLEDGK